MPVLPVGHGEAAQQRPAGGGPVEAALPAAHRLRAVALVPLGDTQVVLGGGRRRRGLQHVAPRAGDQRAAGRRVVVGLGQRAGVQQVQPGPLLVAQGGLVERGAGQFPAGAQHFEGAPARPGGQALAGLGVRVAQPLPVGGVDLGARQGRLQPVLRPAQYAVPLPFGVGVQRPVRLQPGHLALRLQLHVLQLGAGEPGLDLAVAPGARLGEPLLPAPPARSRAPHEEFPAAQHVGRRLHQSVPVRVQGGDPAPPPVRHLVEPVGGVGAVARVRPVRSVVRRHGDAAQPPLVAEQPGLVGGREDAAVLGDGDVGPPVGGHRTFVRVADPDADAEEVRTLRKPQVDLEGQVPQPLPLPQTQHLPAVGGRHAGGVHGRAGEGGVAGGADVPLDAAGEPGAVEGEVGGLEDGVDVEQFTVGRLVEEGGDAAAQGGQDGGPQPVVLQDEGVELAGFAHPPVAVADRRGQQAAQGCVADLAGHLAGQGGPVACVDAVGLVQGAQWRQGVVRAERRGGQRQYLTSDGRHASPWKPLAGPLNRVPTPPIFGGRWSGADVQSVGR